MKTIMLIFGQLALTFVLYLLGVVILGLALFPAVKVLYWAWMISAGWPQEARLLYISFGIVCAYFIFGLSAMIMVGLTRLLLRLKLAEGEYKIGHPMFLKWFFVNALFLSVKTVFMDFMLLTPLCSLFYRLMGARLGLNVQINSKNVADHSLLEIGDNSVIGGNATVIGHSFESKGLLLRKVRLGRNVIVGLNAVILPGVTIGDHAVVAAGVIVPKNTVIEPRTVYYGPPSRGGS